MDCRGSDSGQEYKLMFLIDIHKERKYLLSFFLKNELFLRLNVSPIFLEALA